jgi:hypothetical protein
MSALGGKIVRAIVIEFGQDEVLLKISDTYWFQSFGCVLGFDWYSSGLITPVTGAIKEGLRGMEVELGLFVCGGKGGIRNICGIILCYRFPESSYMRKG